MLQVFLTDLALYNQGRLYGRWINLPMDNEKLNKVISEVLKGGEGISYFQLGYYEPHEEYFITDYEWDDVDLFAVDEYTNLQELNTTLQPLLHLQLGELKAIEFLLSNNIAKDIDDATTKCCDVIIYKNTSMKELVYNLMDELYSVDKLPPLISNHIDYDSIAKELELDGRYYEIENDIYEYVG